ncbi:hypothetical protein BH11PLA2_BH11PLA2_38800 [soil metagenome]
MAFVIDLSSMANQINESDDGSDSNTKIDFFDGRITYQQCEKLWSMILMMAVGDNATSIHYHPLSACVLSYVVDAKRYALNYPPEFAIDRMIQFIECRFHFGIMNIIGWRLRKLFRLQPLTSIATITIYHHTYVFAFVTHSYQNQRSVDIYRLSTMVPELPPADVDSVETGDSL